LHIEYFKENLYIKTTIYYKQGEEEMNKRILLTVSITFLMLSLSVPLVSSYDLDTTNGKSVSTEYNSKIKLERRFFFAEVFGKINVTGNYSVKKIWSNIFSKVVINGTTISDINNLEFFTIWSPFGFIPWQFKNDQPIYLEIRLFKGEIELNETTNCATLFGTGIGVHFVSYVDFSTQ